jgi:hypothetical protein
MTRYFVYFTDGTHCQVITSGFRKLGEMVTFFDRDEDGNEQLVAQFNWEYIKAISPDEPLQMK